MKAHSIVLPALALGAGLLLVDPSSEASGYVLNGSSLGVGQRDFRLFNNFSDPQSNNNTQTKLQFPGTIGAEQAIWKACVEWGSTVHGTGLGDPLQNVGDGGANFDAIWMGNAAATGNTDHNVVSTIGGCASGTLAFAELPSTNGWRIRFCDDQAVFADGPGNIGGEFDIQGVMAHEYGHVIGLGHSSSTQATMYFSIGISSTSERSINSDDQAGVQAIYGVADPSKPVIWETDGNSGSGTLTIRGYNFDATSNDIWFTPSAVTLANTDPRVRVLGIASTNGGTQIDVTIPAGAGAGDVAVKTSASGGASLSNAFPSDLVGVITSSSLVPFSAVSVSPATVDSLDPGTAQTVTISGFQLDTTTSIDFNSVLVDPSRYTLVDSTTITIDLPQGLLGANTIELSDGSDTTSVGITIVEPVSPVLELGTGEAGNPIANGASMNIIVAGTVGTKHQIYYSTSNVASNHPAVSFDIGNNFSNLFFGAVFTVGAQGYTQFSAPVTYLGGSPMLFYSQSVDVTTPPAPQFGVSNVQSVTLTP